MKVELEIPKQPSARNRAVKLNDGRVFLSSTCGSLLGYNTITGIVYVSGYDNIEGVLKYNPDAEILPPGTKIVLTVE